MDLWLSLVMSTSLLKPMSLTFTMGSDLSDKHSIKFSGLRPDRFEVQVIDGQGDLAEVQLSLSLVQFRLLDDHV